MRPWWQTLLSFTNAKCASVTTYESSEMMPYMTTATTPIKGYRFTAAGDPLNNAVNEST